MPTVRYVGNKNPNDSTTRIVLERKNGEVVSSVEQGNSAELSDEQVENLSKKFVLEKSGGSPEAEARQRDQKEQEKQSREPAEDVRFAAPKLGS